MLASLAAVLVAAVPAVGDVAPDFTAKDVDGVEINLAKLVETGPVIVAFFPKARTGGCTKEMEAYRDRYKEIEKLQGRVIAISTDDNDTLKKWKAELKAPQTFVADPDKKLVALYDTKMPIIGMASRRTFVIGAGRKVLEVQEGSSAIEPGGAVAACSLHKDGPAPAPAKK